jgi:hypothetical protein
MKFRYLLFIGLVCVQVTHAQKRFESAALVDSLDFAACKDKSGNYLFDTETAAGNRAVLEHVLLTGANTILWRNCVGGTMRYQSRETQRPWVESPLDKRRLPDNRPVYGWLRYYQSEPDILRDMLDVCHTRGLRAGVHWPFEETHWYSWTIGPFNLEHPQYWGATADGHIWAGRCSLAYPEVVAHKLRLVDELLARGMDHLFIDLWRTGSWGPPDEFVKPEIERWRKRYGTEPPADGRDARWCAFVAETTHAYIAAVRQRLDASGRKVRLMVGILGAEIVSEKPDVTLITRGVDWRKLVKAGVIDTLVVMSVKWDTERPFESTREIYRSILDTCDGRCEVLFPVSMYNFSNKGVPGYQKALKQRPEKIAGELVKIAWEEGADGICQECVDYKNYSAESCAVMRNLLEGPCRFKRGEVLRLP